MARKRIGARRHVATASKHNGKLDPAGTPTYTVPGDWDTVVQSWPCEILTSGGGETVRGRQTTQQTTHVFFGEYFGAEGIDPSMRLDVAGVTYSVVAAYDPTGDSMEMRVEAKRES